ncbi:alpha-hydroxy acid oxidase [Tautonia rosea]|uniref:alpha-hydroxy acid oxidase n=1 Tax=Tautonia rosea TaxID=2728037 RepID=UPI0014734F41|nr:alpha-hydroxy acid oxidase [Tautonia rosea]
MSADNDFSSEVPSVEFLRRRARRRIPGFALDYLEGGCHSEINLERNTAKLRELLLRPYYLRDYPGSDLRTELFGQTYAAPFGIAPIGLQGLMWPRATEILARAAHENNILFCLSTVATASIETVAELTEGRFWFQLYHPAEQEIRDKILDRAEAAGCQTLLILADTPTFGYRPKEIRNGLSIPPRMTLRNVLQMIAHPHWAFSQLRAGAPEFQTLKPYIPPGRGMKHLGQFMNKTFSGRLSEDRVKSLRDKWKGRLVVKGVVTLEDAEKALALGADGIIVSNHGGRQLDAGQATVEALPELVKTFGEKMAIMMDSGIRTGADVATALAAGAHFTFLGRTFMYGVAALGERGGGHCIYMLKRQLQQVMEQVACERPRDFPNHLI